MHRAIAHLYRRCVARIAKLGLAAGGPPWLAGWRVAKALLADWELNVSGGVASCSQLHLFIFTYKLQYKGCKRRKTQPPVRDLIKTSESGIQINQLAWGAAHDDCAPKRRLAHRAWRHAVTTSVTPRHRANIQTTSCSGPTLPRTQKASGNKSNTQVTISQGKTLAKQCAMVTSLCTGYASKKCTCIKSLA